MRHILLAPVALLCMVATPAATAFASLPPGTSPHDEITEAAAKEADYPHDGRAALLEAVRAADLSEMQWEPSADNFVSVGLQDAYRPEHHCDRLLPADHEASFRTTVEYIASQRQAAVDDIAAGNASDAVAALGRALHAVQDCFSHTNAAEQGPDQLNALEVALLDGGAMPVRLRLAAVSAEADSPGEPDDAYGHDGHAKDSPHYNDVAEEHYGSGPTLYDQAHEAATNASVRVLETFLDGLDDAQRRQIAAVDASDQSEFLKAMNGKTIVALLVLAAAIGTLAYAGRKWWQAR